MLGNANFSFDDVAIVSVEACDAPEIVTSAAIDERLAPFYERTGANPGLLESLAGIRQRRQWPAGVSFMDAAAMAGEKALASSGVDRSRVGLLIDSSVCRERLEPSSAVTVHDTLQLPSTCQNFDLSNACLGFLNGIQVAGAMIETGQIDYALIVDGEGTRQIHETTIQKLLQPDSTMDDLFENFATLFRREFGVQQMLDSFVDHAPMPRSRTAQSREVVPAEDPFDPQSYEALLRVDRSVAEKSFPDAFDESLWMD